MTDTSMSLLDDACRRPDSESWTRLVGIYTPLLKGWIGRYDVQDSDADDLVQDVLMVVLRELPTFRHNQRQGAFRSWLRGILVNRVRNFWRARGKRPVARGDSDFLAMLAELEDPRSQLSRVWDREHDRHLTQRLLEVIEPRFSPSTRQAFRRLVIDGVDPDQVASELNMSLNAVFTAKSRVLRELRRMGRGLLD
jgi:RNA polymerase sigma-70 factor (ECF subfamily)